MKPCTQCGRCCTNSSFMGSMSASVSDLRRWKRQHHYDILQYAYENGKVGMALGFPAADLWIKPNGDEAERCPFVRKVRGRDRYTCTIYDTRPEACREYPLNVCHMQFVDCEMLDAGDTDADVAKFMGRTERKQNE